MRTTIICSVGTSLLSNARNLDPISAAEITLKNAYIAQNPETIAKALTFFGPMTRICGAEINTISSLSRIRKRYKLDPRNFYLLVSDTSEGSLTGQILKTYLNINWRALGFEIKPHLIIRTIVELQDQLPFAFKSHGLRNLVREISRAIHETGGPEMCAIDATGGYKAQIAISVMFGQMSGIPVFYKHEKFNTIIDFPPMPIAFDYSLYEQYFDLLYCLCQGNEILNAKELTKYFMDSEIKTGSSMEILEGSATFQRFRVFLDEVEEEGLFAISPAGNIYFESAWQKFDTMIQQNIDELLPPCNKNERKPPHFTDDHFPLGFKEYVNHIFNNHPWIKSIHTVAYDRQRAIKGNYFYIGTVDSHKELIGTYCDKNGFGARFSILAKKPTDTSLHAAFWLLTREFAEL